MSAQTARRGGGVPYRGIGAGPLFVDCADVRDGPACSLAHRCRLRGDDRVSVGTVNAFRQAVRGSWRRTAAGSRLPPMARRRTCSRTCCSRCSWWSSSGAPAGRAVPPPRPAAGHRRGGRRHPARPLAARRARARRRRRSCSRRSVAPLLGRARAGRRRSSSCSWSGSSSTPRLLRQRRTPRVAISHASIVVPFLLGVGARALAVPAARRPATCRSPSSRCSWASPCRSPPSRCWRAS